MPAYLLDTNILSDIVKNPNGPAAQTHQRLTVDPSIEVLTSIVVACEVQFGAIKKGSLKLTARVNELLEGIRIASLDVGADQAYARLRADLEHRGQPIGQNDMLIAAHAIALNATLVTDNVREFKRIKGLRVENWLRA
jgi:tRNA(fMet)-specific endonuclease VapC